MRQRRQLRTFNVLNRRLKSVRKKVFTVFLLCLAFTFHFENASAQLTTGNIVVEQVGDGTTALGSAATKVQLLQFTVSGSAQTGTGYFGSTGIPTSSPYNLVETGSGTSNGYISLSTDKSFIVISGYNGAIGTAGIASSNAATNGRTIGKAFPDGTISANGTFNTLTGNNYRSVVSNGSAYWLAGAGGIVYTATDVTSGIATTATTIFGTNTRNGLIFNNTLFVSTSSSSFNGAGSSLGIYQVGSFNTLPTSLVTAGTATNIINSTSTGSPYAFAFSPNGLTCYVADDRAIASGGGIQKWIYSGTFSTTTGWSGGSWSLTYTLNPSTGTALTFGARGLTVDFSGASPVLYATTSETALNRVVKITDAGASSSATLLATATTNTIFRGICFAPNASCSNTTSSSSVTSCNTYTWANNNTTYTASGIYTQTSLIGSGPCTNTDTLNLTINNTTSSSVSATACDTYTWSANSVTYMASGAYTATSLNAAGCTDATTLNLTINNSSSSSVSETACDTYTWSANSVTYTVSGAYTATSLNAAGCTHTETLNLTINNSTTSSETQSACDSYTWAANGVTYNASGTYTSLNAAGCLNTDTLNLTITPSSTNTTTIAANNSYTWSVTGQTYTTSGIKTGTTTNCVTELLDLTITPIEVNLSISANAGSEAAGTIVTVTATASAPVNGIQSVSLGVSGTGITAGDYTLSNSTITIPNGQTTGSVTFTMVNDVLVEGTETATLTISSPSAGITLGTPTTQNISITDNDVALDINLCNYVRVGRYDLPEPTRTTPPANSVLAQEVSGVTCNWDSNTLFVVGDGGTSVVQVSKTGQLINSMTLATGGSPQGNEFYDPEGITYIGNGQFVMTEERDRRAVKFTYVPGTTLTRAAAETVTLGTFVQNIGLEGLTYDPITGGYIFVKEITPLGIFQTGIDFNAGTATNGSASTVNSIDLFNPSLTGLSDFADVYALANIPSLSTSDNLLVLSQEDGKIVNISRTGVISSSLKIVSDPGNPLTVAAQQHEGLTMDSDGILYVVSENGGGDFDHPQLWVYAPSVAANQAPTAITLSNSVTSIVENTSTTARIKLADINVVDDGLVCNNTLSLSGPDASFLEIIGTELFLKAGTVLDYETKTSYTVTINVDDASLGTTPDATLTYTLSVTDVVIETPPGVTLIVSEVAPWSSGNSPVAADWFELTNTGTVAVNISGWKMDDNSNSFASSVALNGITSIAPGESVIFLESAAPATIVPLFKSNWFGANPPASLQVGTYTGGGVGLGSGGDAVNIFDAAGQLQAKLIFGSSPAGPSFPTFDNAIGINNATISNLSVAGVYDAFVAINSAVEIGSPGSIGKLYITEVAPWSSSNSPVAADWFEVTNTKATAVDITGWKMDDNSGSPAAAVALNGITSIAPGESVIFIESAAPATVVPLFKSTWFGVNPPATLQVGTYTGSGVGLGTGGDQVNLYNNAGVGVLQASVSFGNSPTGPYRTFDNAAKLNSITPAITLLSSVGVNGAFIAFNSNTEIGSPGRIVTAACPTITVTATQGAAIACNGGTTTVTVSVSGGIAPYTGTGTFTVGAGTYNYIVTDAYGCTATTAITITQPAFISTSSSATACDSYTWSSNGVTYTASGTYTYTSLNAAGCLNTETLNLTVNTSSTSSSTQTSCDSYTWAANGVTYTTSGTYTSTSLNASGCLNTETLNLVINSSTSASQSVSAYLSYIWAVNGATYTASGTYTVTSANGAGCLHTATLNLTILTGVSISPKVILSGAYDVSTGLMYDSLRVNNLIPTVEPYSSAPFMKPQLSGPGGETVSSATLAVTGNDAIVDWVFVELRSALNSSIIVATKRALLQRDGDVVNADGTSPLFFNGVAGDNYFVSIKHRNHLGVMSASSVPLAFASTSIDFTSASTAVYTNPSIANAPRKIQGSVATLWPGDGNNNKNVKYNGLSNDKDAVLQALANNVNSVVSGYRAEDVNLDGKVKYNNTNNDRSVIGAQVGVVNSNTVISQHTPN